ncbi:ABC transporter ATP-binding protein [Nocardioides pacificus]
MKALRPRPGVDGPAHAEVARLAVREATLRFGGLTVLDKVSFTVAPGAIHAIIGPNGAGKSSLFNSLVGVYRLDSGSVHLGDAQLSGLRPYEVARAGVGRSFQNIVLAPRSSVLDNLMLGRYRLTKAGFWQTGLGLPSSRREEARHSARVKEIADLLGLSSMLSVPAGDLSYGDRKLVDIARAVCQEPRLLLLDEPVAGLHRDETLRVAQAIIDLRAALGPTILFVEHDMGMVMSLADHVTVLDFGKVVGDGPPSQVQQEPAVVRAYLGESGSFGTPTPSDKESEA